MPADLLVEAALLPQWALHGHGSQSLKGSQQSWTPGEHVASSRRRPHPRRPAVERDRLRVVEETQCVGREGDPRRHLRRLAVERPAPHPCPQLRHGLRPGPGRHPVGDRADAVLAAVRRVTASSRPSASQPERGGATPAQASFALVGGTGSGYGADAACRARPKRSSTAASGTVTSSAAGSARRSTRRPRTTGPFPPCTGDTYAASTARRHETSSAVRVDAARPAEEGLEITEGLAVRQEERGHRLEPAIGHHDRDLLCRHRTGSSRQASSRSRSDGVMRRGRSRTRSKSTRVVSARA